MAKSKLTRTQYRSAASEHSLQMTVLKYLRLNTKPGDALWFAIPNAGKRSRWAAAHMKAEGLTAGVADLCVMLAEGITIWLELKTAKGRQTPAQRAFQAFCKARMHHYYIVRSLDEAIAIFQSFYLVKGPRAR